MFPYPFVPHDDYREYPRDEMRERARNFYENMKRRRTVRDFSERDVPREIIEQCLLAAGTAPSGANRQPWHFVADRNKSTAFSRVSDGRLLNGVSLGR